MTVANWLKAPPFFDTKRANEAMPDGVLPFEPFGSVPLTETEKLVDVVCDGSVVTALVGGVVSISHDVDIEPVPELPYWSVMSAASTVSVYSPSAVVKADSPPSK